MRSLLIKVQKLMSQRILYLFFHNASSKSHKHRFTGLLCADPPPPPPEQSRATSWYLCHYCLNLFNPLNFFFSGRLSFPRLDSRRMHWGWKFWQGTLRPYNWHIFMGIKFVMLNLRELLITAKFNRIFTAVVIYLIFRKCHYFYRGFTFKASWRKRSNMSRLIEIIILITSNHIAQDRLIYTNDLFKTFSSVNFFNN